MTIDEIIDKLNMLKFFYGQRSGLELWNEKPTEVQEKDIETTNIVLDAAISALEHQKWIPCSERLPEETGTYLVTMDGEICGDDDPFTSICGFENGKWDEGDMVLAWMPLPEPYRGEIVHEKMEL